MAYERPNIAALHAYAPGEQPQTGRVIKLNTNENPYPPVPAVMEAIRAVEPEQLRRYPPPLATPFRKAAARVHDIGEDQVIATNGGDELLRLAITVFCQPSHNPVGSADAASGATAPRGLGIAEPSYSLYPVLAQIHDTPITRVELNDDFSLTGDYAQQLNAAGCGLAMIVNPHAPSGRLQPLEELEAIAKAFNGVLLIDEAYVDFAERDALPLVRNGVKNVLLLRSLSKGYSLAGLRYGYGMGHPDLIAALDKARDSYNTDALSQAAAVAAITHRDEARTSWQKVIAERARLGSELTDRGFKVYPSQSNFLLVVPHAATGPRKPIRAGLTANAIYEALKSESIFVRYFQQDRLEDKLRITIGTPEENDLLLAALDRL